MVNYVSSPEKSFVLENFVELKNDQPVSIFLKPDYDDKDYTGPGKYLVKLKRFTASGSPSDYSNSLELDLSYTATTPQPTPTSTPTPTPTSNSTPTKTPTVTPTPTKIVTNTTTPTSKTVTVNPTPSPSEIRDLKSEISTSPQVLSTSTSQTYIATSSAGETYDFQAELNFATPSSMPVSDKTLFIIGASIFSLSGGLLYFRLKNL